MIMNPERVANSFRSKTTANSTAALAVSIVMLLVGACSATAAAPQPVVDKGLVSVVRFAPGLVPTATTISPTLLGAADALQQVYINVYQRVAPSVVNIETLLKTNTTGEVDASGSGFVYDTDGHIITNAHVIQDAKTITVTFNDGYLTTGTVIGEDDYSDIAILLVKAPQDKLLPVILGDSTNLKVGQAVVTIGNPFGLLSSMTTGIVSATGRTLRSSQMLNPNNPNNQFSNPSIIQTDAQINPGNSGGPLLDLNGSVIGINTAIRTESGVFQGVGFAVPVNTLKRVVPQLLKKGKVDYSWLGVGSSDRLTVASIAEELQLPVAYGVLVDKVYDGSPAAAAGLKEGPDLRTIRGVEIHVGGDIIIAINGHQVRDMDALISYLVENTSPGDTVTLTIIRGNETLDVKLALTARTT